jgi:hypothetical protein
MSKEELKSIIDDSGKFEEDRIQSGIYIYRMKVLGNTEEKER